MPVEVDNVKPVESTLNAPVGAVNDAWRQNQQTGQKPADTTYTDIQNASHSLVEKNVLPAVSLTDWTVAIDLVGTVNPHQGNPQGGGVERELPQLQALAKETEGKSVNFLVHAERPVDEDGKLCKQDDPDKTAACNKSSIARSESQASTERYFIHDGKIDRLPDADYIDANGDVEDLLKEAKTLSPSKNIGLIIGAHGAGSNGISTNIGDVALSDEMDGIKKGLAGSGHDKLDILDFNACDMGEAKVVAAAGAVTKDLVASPAAEFTTGSFDGQNMVSEMRTLFANSKMSGAQWGESMVKQAQSGGNGNIENSGTPTLSNYDLSKYDAAQTALDTFGTALSASTQVGDNLKVLRADVDKSAVPDTAMVARHQNDRDIKDFAGNVLADIQAHKLSGDTKDLEAAAKAVIDSQNQLVTAKFGEHNKGYDKLGGMTAYLPGSEILDSDRVSRELSPLHEAGTRLQSAADGHANLQDKSEILTILQGSLSKIPEGTVKAYPDEALKLDQARQQIEKSQSSAELVNAMKNLETTLKGVEQGPMGTQIINDMRANSNEIQKSEIEYNGESLTPGWDDFVARLQATAH